ncbi:MAG: NAD-dependent malic enzyme [Chloroflexi bacterium]|jgi:malate dehydrogenase (oxaloacetate-decarboxylating)|nr:NAD-dependent malic enzyme [Chloroflexota bacterium]
MSSIIKPSASYSLTIRTETTNRPGMLGLITTTIGQEGGDIGAIDIANAANGKMMRDITVAARDEAHGETIVAHLRSLDGVRVVNVSDRTFLMHLGGKIEIRNRYPVKTRDDLSMVYTPGVARVCLAIKDDPAKQWALTIKRNTVAVVTDGSAVLGLGNIGPAAAQPVMEGKCMLFKSFAGLDAFPICLNTQDSDEIVRAVQMIAPVFGAINLEDISAPRCYEIEDRLRQMLNIPVMHDDQHGTAIVVLAALKNALKVVNKPMHKIKVVVNGIGSAGMAICKILLAVGVKRLVACDKQGALCSGKTPDMLPHHAALAEISNPERDSGSLHEVLRGADVFIGVSAPNLLTSDHVYSMAIDPILFALANPTPEVRPESVAGIARIVATGRSDYPNQINNSLAFPGVFKGALEVQATDINEMMKLAAAEAIANLVATDELHDEYIIPSMFDTRVVDAVATATREAAIASGVARRG